ncbi:hypothetical protein NLX86_08190 [Streptomyces sp. A3M-1-3]|uniref:hypothetical protein n=1 Tax=Streptomyces sp. A3M-1-3 TaxID=2962044 RepID=UPI0020B6B3C5|nr:hypothetical protein [Streptomyces sp. A3M-1-3]MCP3818091.1 hypothetical protein [Streptomyces sp. A3M-1-3]
MALRLSREQRAVEIPEDATTVDTLPSVAHVLSRPAQTEPPTAEAVPKVEEGDDDGDSLEELDEEIDFYATALKDIDD